MLIKYRPTRIIMMGGYVSLPVGIAGFILRTPRDLYELNAVPGKAVKLLAPFSTTVNVCFKEALYHFKASKTYVVSYPLRFKEPTITRDKAHALLGLDAARITILILGGSQGSISLNKHIVESLQAISEGLPQFNIIHQTGHLDPIDWKLVYGRMGLNALVFDYRHDLSSCYQAADIIICRAGSGTIFEALHFKKQIILVPLEISGNNHQLYNAHAIAQEYPELCTVIRHHELLQQSYFTKVLQHLITGKGLVL